MNTVSVIIPAYNQGRYLGQAIQSVFDQTWPDFEILVVDDGSTDNTREIVHAFQDPRLQYVYQRNQGLSAARNTGIRHARGPLLSFLDSDDLFLPEKLALLVAALEKKPGAGFAAGQAVIIDEQGATTGEVFDKGLPENPVELLLGNPLHVGSVLVRREWLDRVGFFDESLRSYEDWDMWLRLAKAGCPMRWVPQPVSLYRFHQAQMTRDGAQMTTATFAVLDKTFQDPALPENWRKMRTRAYSRGHLREAAQAYHARDFSHARAALAKAVQLDPQLTDAGAAPLARHLAGWANYSKTSCAFDFLESVYNHLPDCLTGMRHRRRRDLSQFAIQKAFEAFEAGHVSAARAAAWRAIRYRPAWLGNRGVLAILWRSRPTRAEPNCSDPLQPDGELAPPLKPSSPL